MTTDYAEIGTLLRTARKERGLSIEQAAQMLHIRVRYLESLEQGNFEELPGLAYAKGYLQAYVNFLNLDRMEIQRRFERVEVTMGRRGIYFPDILSRAKTPSTQMVWGGLAAALVLYSMWWALFKPQHYDVSTVDAWPQQGPEKATISAETAQNVPCLSPQAVLYPPCHVTGEMWQSPFPLQGQLNSVMDLARYSNSYE